VKERGKETEWACEGRELKKSWTHGRTDARTLTALDRQKTYNLFLLCLELRQLSVVQFS